MAPAWATTAPPSRYCQTCGSTDRRPADSTCNQFQSGPTRFCLSSGHARCSKPAMSSSTSEAELVISFGTDSIRDSTSESVGAPLEAESRIESVPYEITSSASLVEEDIAGFEQRAWPDERQNRVGPLWNWLHVESAGRLSVEPQVWQYREGGAVVAHAGAIPVKLRIDGQNSLAAWIVAA